MRFMVYAHRRDEQQFAYPSSMAEAIELGRRWRDDGMAVEISDRTGAAYSVDQFVDLYRNDTDGGSKY